MSNRSFTQNRIRSLVAGTMIAAGAVVGLAGCNGGAQTYPESTDPVTGSPTPTPGETSTPVPTTVDESGTLDGN